MTTAREELANVEARIAQVREENAALEKRLLKPTRSRNLLVAGVVLATLGGMTSFFASLRAGDLRAGGQRAAREAKHAESMSWQRGSTESCKLDARRVASELARCKSTPPPSGPGLLRKCVCEPGDPLCSCL